MQQNGCFLLHVHVVVSSFTSDSGIVVVLFAVAVLLTICVLLCVLQTQFMTNLKSLADSPNNTHGLALNGWKRRTNKRNSLLISRHKNPILLQPIWSHFSISPDICACQYCVCLLAASPSFLIWFHSQLCKCYYSLYKVVKQVFTRKTYQQPLHIKNLKVLVTQTINFGGFA